MTLRWMDDHLRPIGLACRRQWLHGRFTYAGVTRVLPCLYLFPEGIIFDILTPLDEAAMQTHHEACRHVTDTLSTAQARAIMDENPFDHVPLTDIVVDGQAPPPGWGCHCEYHMPTIEPEACLPKELRAYREDLQGCRCFARERYQIPLAAGPFSPLQRFGHWLHPRRVGRMEGTTYPLMKFHPLELELPVYEGQGGASTLCFVHPHSKTQHTIHFGETEPLAVPFDHNLPRLLVQTYDVQPPLPQGDRLAFDSSFHNPPVAPDHGACAEASVVSVGVLGGADGPTAIYLGATPQEGAVRPLHTCVAKPPSREGEPHRIVLSGIETMQIPEEKLTWSGHVGKV